MTNLIKHPMRKRWNKGCFVKSIIKSYSIMRKKIKSGPTQIVLIVGHCAALVILPSNPSWIPWLIHVSQECIICSARTMNHCNALVWPFRCMTESRKGKKKKRWRGSELTLHLYLNILPSFLLPQSVLTPYIWPVTY